MLRLNGAILRLVFENGDQNNKDARPERELTQDSALVYKLRDVFNLDLNLIKIKI